MTDEAQDSQDIAGVTEQGEASEEGQRFAIGLTPFGHIGINITDSNGTTAGYLINNPEDGSRIVVHLLSLLGMMIQGAYAQAMQEQQLAAELISGNGKGGGLWTPGT